MRIDRPQSRAIRGYDQDEIEPNCVAIIPARGGSKRIPRKNIRDFKGDPIIAHTIKKATLSGLFRMIVTSTEDYEISTVAAHYESMVAKRPESLAADDIGTQQVAHYTLEYLSNEWHYHPTWVCVIYPTAPLMSVKDLKYGRALIDMLGIDYAIGVGTEPLADAGQFYWGTREAFLHQKPLYDVRTAMVPIATDRMCDINTEADWQRAEQMYDNLILKGLQDERS